MKTPKQLRWFSCANCASKFHHNHGNQKFCSLECVKTYRKEYKRLNAAKNYQKEIIKKRTSEPVICKHCKKLIFDGHGNMKIIDR